MMDRLQIIMQSDGEYTKEDINNYVFNGIKPKKKKNDEQNKEEENKDENNEKENKDENNEKENKGNNEKTKEGEEDNGEYNGNNAFITSLQQ